MLILAISLSDELEKIGAYAGIAAFFGFAVLIVLYFAQAREVKRLREWAGRAPERAAELEHRVVAAADARRVRAEPMKKPAAVPATPAGAAAAKPAAAKPEEAAAVATGAAIAAAAAGASAPAAAGASAPAAAGATAPGGPGASAPPATATPGTPPSPAVPAPAEGVTGDGAPPAKPAEAGAAAPADEAPLAKEPEKAPEPETGEEAAAANGAPGEIPAVPPRATPVPRATPAPPPPRRPVPAASLRSTRPTATPRRAGAVHASRHPPVPPDEGRSRRSLVLASAGVVVGLLVVAVVGTQLLGGDETNPPPNVPRGATPTPAPVEEDITTPSDGGQSAARGDTTVAVLNGTTTPGLAATISDRLASAGFAKGVITNFSDSQRVVSLLFYAPGASEAAREVGRVLKITDRQPMNPDVQSLAVGADVVVVVGSDQTP